MRDEWHMVNHPPTPKRHTHTHTHVLHPDPISRYRSCGDEESPEQKVQSQPDGAQDLRDLFVRHARPDRDRVGPGDDGIEDND